MLHLLLAALLFSFSHALLKNMQGGEGVLVGCYEDKSSRDLPHRAPGGNKFTNWQCNKYCREKGYKFSGNQWHGECWCGNDYGKYSKKPMKDCLQSCRANNSKLCGGGWRNRVYRLTAYAGCYEDKGTRDLNHRAPNERTVKYTPSKCQDYCKSKSYRFAGVQYHRECWCGNRYGRYGKRNDSDCRIKCEGDKNKICGGTWRNSVYATGVHGYGHLLGCFEDKSSRDLPHRAPNGNKYTNWSCNQYCRGKGYAFAGNQWHGECWCGNDYGKYGRKSMNDCKKSCRAGGNECGGGWRNRVYRLTRLIGCFVDKSSRDLSHRIPGGNKFTIDSCQTKCRDAGYKYAGNQWGGECWCGNTFGKYGKKPMSECTQSCRANGQKLCGGGWRNRIFRVKQYEHLLNQQAFEEQDAIAEAEILEYAQAQDEE